MEINFKIRTRDNSLRANIFHSDSVKHGDKIEISESNIIIESKDTDRINAHLPIDIINILASGVVGVSTGIIANYFYDKIKGKADTLLINDNEVEIELKKIKEALDKVIEKLQDDK